MDGVSKSVPRRWISLWRGGPVVKGCQTLAASKEKAGEGQIFGSQLTKGGGAGTTHKDALLLPVALCERLLRTSVHT